MRRRRSPRSSSRSSTNPRRSNNPRGPSSRSESSSEKPVYTGTGVSEPEFAESVGTTLEDAIEKALDVLDAREDEVDVEILEEGKRGFLGFGIKRPYRVRVSWREDTTAEIMVDETPAGEPGPGADAIGPDRPPLEKSNERVEVGDGRAGSTVDLDRAVREARSITEDLLSRMGMDCVVRAESSDGEVVVDLSSGADEGLLIGKRGETRAALQHIVHRILSKQLETSVTIRLDVANYWEKRIGRLTRDAHDLANQAMNRQREFKSDLLSPQERRVIHKALLEDTRVTTESIGKGLYKRVLVKPTLN